MRFEKLMTAVDSHTEGMPTRIVTSGFGQVPGHTMFEKQHYIEEHLDHLRGFLMCEPRGHTAMNGVILLPPTDPEADLGVVYIDVDGYLPMCGHGTIGTYRRYRNGTGRISRTADTRHPRYASRPRDR